MQLLLTDAKTMRDHTPITLPLQPPPFKKEAEKWFDVMARHSIETLAQLFKCSEAVAQQTYRQFQQGRDGQAPLLPALLAYHGQVYRHLHPERWTSAQWQQCATHLLIPSFLYGLLRPLDAIQPYRMSGDIRHENGRVADFWKPLLTPWLIQAVQADDGILLFLSTTEFKQLFDWKKVAQEVNIISPRFAVEKAGKLTTLATYAKRCRGAMTEFLITHPHPSPDAIKEFRFEGFTYSAPDSTPTQPIFVRQQSS